MPVFFARCAVQLLIWGVVLLPPLSTIAEETVSPPPSPLPAPPDDPCAELKAELARLKGKKRARVSGRAPKKKRRSGRTPRGTTIVREKRSTQAAATASLQTPDTTCAGALTKKGVEEILATTRDFTGKNLNCLDLSGLDLRRSNFTGATLIRSTLSRASLDEANLERANLSGAIATNASFHLAGITGVILDGATLDGSLWVDRQRCAPPSIGRCRDSFQHAPPPKPGINPPEPSGGRTTDEGVGSSHDAR
ncbi:MAG: hypothetical protein Fur0034_16190 [Desulfuromonadia bacterium]